MGKLKFILAIILLVFLCGNVFAAPQALKVQYDERFKEPENTSTPVLKGGISQIQELPSGMYGMWQVHGTLLETTNFDKFVETSSDIWILRKDGPFVTLINPQNGASATITITEVKDNTATFVRSVGSGNIKESEQVTLTLDGDTFTGVDVIMSQVSINGIHLSDIAKYKINGVKISGQTIFRPRSSMEF